MKFISQGKGKFFPVLLFALALLFSAQFAGATEYLYLRDDSSFNATNPVDSLAFHPPWKGTLLDFDSDGLEGLTIYKNYSPLNPLTYQIWLFENNDIDRLLDGTVEIHFYSRMKDYFSGTKGSLLISLIDDSSSTFSIIGSTGPIQDNPWGLIWNEKIASIPVTSYKLRKGHRLGILMYTGPSSSGPILIAYDATPYPSYMVLPTKTTLLISASADSIKPAVYAGENNVNLLSMELDPSGYGIWVDSLALTQEGSGNMEDAGNVFIWEDAGALTPGRFDPQDDLLIAGTTYNSGRAVFTDLNLILAGQRKLLFAVHDIPINAPNGDLIGCSISNQSSIWTSADTLMTPSGSWPQPDSIVTATIINPANTFIINEVFSPLDYVMPGQTGIELFVVVTNALGNDAIINSGGPTFTLSSPDDRAGDYTVAPSPSNPAFIPAGITDTLNYTIEVATGALLDSLITLDASYTVLDFGNGMMNQYSGATVNDRWRVINGTFNAIAYLFDSKNTPERWDDSLVSFVETSGITYNSSRSIGDPFGTLVQDSTTIYRLVLEINPSLASFDFNADLSSEAYWAIQGLSTGFAEEGMESGSKELLITRGNLADQYVSSIDHLKGFTSSLTPPQPWDPLTNPLLESVVDTASTEEVGEVVNIFPQGASIDCMDGGGTWETPDHPMIDADRFFFSELWLKPDMDWMTGDTARVYMHINGEGANAPEISSLIFPMIIADDDTTGPQFTLLTPAYVPAGESLFIATVITDPSGVHDESAGSSSQGPYILWDTDGEVAADALEITLTRISGDTFVTDYPIPPLPPGAEITYRAAAYDNDFDGSRPSDRSKGWSEVDTLTVAMPASIIDSASTIYPDQTTNAGTFLELHIGVNNLSPVGVMLDTSSRITFSDGISTFNSSLANPTFVPGFARNFTLTFNAEPVPPGINAPAFYDPLLLLYGMDETGVLYSDTLNTGGRNRIFVDVPKVTVNALPISVIPVMPGTGGVPLMLLHFTNETPADQQLDTLRVTNLSFGTGTQAQLDGEIDLLFLFEDADTSYTLTSSDSLLSISTFISGQAAFDVAGKWTLKALQSGVLIIGANIDSTGAKDGDVIDAVILSPGDISFASGVPISPAFSPLYPLDSFGFAIIDGMAASQITLYPGTADTLFSESSNNLILTLTIPQNGYSMDTLTSLAFKNYSPSFDPSDLSSVGLYADDGDGVFTQSDAFVGAMVFSGDRYEISGTDLSIDKNLTLFITAGVSSNPGNGDILRPGLPLDAVGVASGNDGPMDQEVISTHAFTIKKLENITIDNRSINPAGVNPGSRNVPLLFFSIKNNTLARVKLDSLRIGNNTTGNGTTSDLDREMESLSLYEDDGNGRLDDWDAVLKRNKRFSSGGLTLDSLNILIEPDMTKYLLICCDVDSLCASDGDSLSLTVDSKTDVYFDSLYAINGYFPVTSINPPAIDGMLSYQINVHSKSDSFIVNETNNILVFDFALPANGYQTDTLQSITLDNHGSATSEHIARLALYKDGGNGVFDSGTGDDLYLGDFLDLGSKYYGLSNLSAPLEGACGDQTRFFVSADLNTSFSTGASIQFEIPKYGISVATGNDGPIDSPVIDPFVQIIPKPDEITIFPYSVGDKTVLPGDEKKLNFGIGCYNGYSKSFVLESLRLFQDGTAISGEVSDILAFEDSDSNGLFDPVSDSLIASGYFDNGYYSLNNMSLSLNPKKITYLFVVYDLSLSVRDSVSIDLQLNGSKDILFSSPSLVIQGEFPINSPGVDLTDGMIAAQIDVTNCPAYRAAANENDIKAANIVIPSNGILPDILKRLTIVNMGTALAGRDIADVKVWRESGGDPSDFDPVNDTFLAYLFWSGSAWTSNTLNEQIPKEGIRIYVTFSTSSTPVNGMTFRASIPLRGIEVSSGNDGPIDKPVTNGNEQTISTDELIVSLRTDRSSYSMNQNVVVEMRVRNQGTNPISGVHPSALTLTGSAAAVYQSGPFPTVTDLAPGEDSTFVWSYKAASPGVLSFCGNASNIDSSVIAEPSCTGQLTFQTHADSLDLSLQDITPAGANKGQENIPLFKSTFAFPSTDSTTAPVTLNNVYFTITDGSSPVRPGEAISRITLSEPSGRQIVFNVTDTLSNPLQIPINPSITINPGDALNLSTFADILDSTTRSSLALEIGGPGCFDVTDINDSTSVPLQSSMTFPWIAGWLSINSPSESLMVSGGQTDTTFANKDQRNVAAFALQLTNDSPADASGALLTDLKLEFYDLSGAPLPPNEVIRTVTISSGGNEICAIDELPASSNSLLCSFISPPLLPPQSPRDLQVSVDIRAFPSKDGFYIAIVDEAGITAKDNNSGSVLPVHAGNSQAFPFESKRVLIQESASGVRVDHVSDFDTYILPGTQAIRMISLVFSHMDSVGASTLSLDSLAISFMDSLGQPFYPGNYFNSILLTWNSDTILTDASLSGVSNIEEFKFGSPMDITPSGPDTLNIFINAKSNYSPASFAVRIDQHDIVIMDNNDGTRIYSLAGSFPMVSKLAYLLIPSGEMQARILSKLPANITCNETGLEAFDLMVTNANPPGYTEAEICSLTLAIHDRKGRLLNPNELISNAYLRRGSTTLAAGSLSPSSVVFHLQTGSVITPAGGTDTLSFAFDLNTSLRNENVYFSFDDSSSISAFDRVSSNGLRIIPAGGSFPIRTSFTHILGESMGESFTNYPNPFAAGREATRITFFLEKDSKVNLRLYTIWGKKVKTIIDNKKLYQGLHQEYVWDGRNDDGDVVNNGVYFLRIEVDEKNGRHYERKRKVGVIR